MQRIICGDENKFEDPLVAEVDKYNKVQLKGKFVAEKPDVPSSSNDVFKEVRHPLADVTQRASNFNVDDDDEFWCNPLIMKAVDDAFEKYEENMKSHLLCPPTVNSTHVSVGHNFSNISNCHITFNVSDANVAAGILKDLSKK
ncbi:hypothetical protein O6H91_04G073200 [Diphasiastrum complanatum]|uniref:Uncharacterized protein n=1 Tax=Diphasiastrum complanatum TaxID=34168 RepID=A0ACC2DY59_DIPCM|nr:hypothetical protein O6H91_04G073200 [Diphasiastrum complanatum]